MRHCSSSYLNSTCSIMPAGRSQSGWHLRLRLVHHSMTGNGVAVTRRAIPGGIVVASGWIMVCLLQSLLLAHLPPQALSKALYQHHGHKPVPQVSSRSCNLNERFRLSGRHHDNIMIAFCCIKRDTPAEFPLSPPPLPAPRHRPIDSLSDTTTRA
jgi:hypothetical protein